MKKFLLILKFLFVSVCWSTFLISIFAVPLKIFWDFNAFNIKSWIILSEWWERGGNINSWQDALFFLLLLAFIPLLILGIRKGMKLNLVQILIKPVIYFANRGLDEAPKDIVIKNIDVSVQKTSKEEFIDRIVTERIKKMDEANPPEKQEKTYEKIRKGLAEKELPEN